MHLFEYVHFELSKYIFLLRKLIFTEAAGGFDLPPSKQSMYFAAFLNDTKLFWSRVHINFMSLNCTLNLIISPRALKNLSSIIFFLFR